jgi:hypothetical protein
MVDKLATYNSNQDTFNQRNKPKDYSERTKSGSAPANWSENDFEPEDDGSRDD